MPDKKDEYQELLTKILDKLKILENNYKNLNDAKEKQKREIQDLKNRNVQTERNFSELKNEIRKIKNSSIMNDK